MLHLGLASVLLCTLTTGDPADNTRAQPAMATDVAEKLKDRVNFDGFDDPKMTLQDALEYLADRYDLSFDVDDKAFTKAFGKDNPKSVLAEPIATTPVPRMRGVTLERVIRKILSRIEVASGATYLIHGDQIFITTQATASKEVLGDSERELPLLVQRRLEKRPLRDALEELADLTGVSVLLDESVGDKAKEMISARFMNTPIETAVRLLANKVNLSTVRLNNVLYVTTREKADELREELKREENRMARERMLLADEEPKKDENNKAK